MNLEIGLYLLITFASVPKCQSWIKDYPYNSVFDTSDLSQISGINFPLTHENLQLYKKIIDNQIRAHKIIYGIENDPTQIKGQSPPKNDPLKKIYFSTYPHTKALLELQWKRLHNSLFIHKLGSLRVHSPFYRP